MDIRKQWCLLLTRHTEHNKSSKTYKESNKNTQKPILQMQQMWHICQWLSDADLLLPKLCDQWRGFWQFYSQLINLSYILVWLTRLGFSHLHDTSEQTHWHNPQKQRSNHWSRCSSKHLYHSNSKHLHNRVFQKKNIFVKYRKILMTWKYIFYGL